MVFKNTVNEYGLIAKWFHWGTVLLFLISYCAIYYRELFADSDFENWITIQLHFSIGISIFGIVLMRIVWRSLNTSPNQESFSTVHLIMIKAGHIALYKVMLIMPISGYLSLVNYLTCKNGNIDYFFLLDLTFLKSTEFCRSYSSVLITLEKPADFIHSITGKWLVPTLVLGHLLAALYHHFIKQDNTLNKITRHKS